MEQWENPEKGRRIIYKVLVENGGMYTNIKTRFPEDFDSVAENRSFRTELVISL